LLVTLLLNAKVTVTSFGIAVTLPVTVCVILVVPETKVPVITGEGFHVGPNVN
jgi:hypothetical protein